MIRWRLWKWNVFSILTVLFDFISVKHFEIQISFKKQLWKCERRHLKIIQKISWFDDHCDFDVLYFNCFVVLPKMFQLKQNELLFPICCYEVKNLFSDLGKTSGTQRYKAFSFYKDTMWFTLVLGLCLVSSIHGFSEGAGTSACKGNLQMKPSK